MQHTIVIEPCGAIVQSQQTAPLVLVVMFDEETQNIDIHQFKNCAMDTYAKILNKTSRDRKTIPPEMAASVIAAHLNKTFGVNVMGFPVDTVFCLTFDKSQVKNITGPQEIKLNVSCASFAYSKEIKDITTRDSSEKETTK